MFFIFQKATPVRIYLLYQFLHFLNSFIGIIYIIFTIGIVRIIAK